MGRGRRRRKNRKKKKKINNHINKTTQQQPRHHDKNENEWSAEEVNKRIEYILCRADSSAEMCSKIPRKFPRGWRWVFGDLCVGLPFPTLVNAVCERYGRVQVVNHLNGETSGALVSIECNDKGGGDDALTWNHVRDGKGCNRLLDCNSMEEILARLPLPSLMRAKIVCKAWNRAIGALNVNVKIDRHFVTHHISHRCHGIAFFSSSLNRWFRIPEQWTRQWTWDCYRPFCLPEIILCAAGGGLFLFVDWHSGPDTPVVFNPLTKKHRVLPDFPVKHGWRPGMAVELIAETDHFKVITIPVHDAVNWDMDPLLYNSSTDKWTSIPITGNNPTTGIYWSDSHPWSSTLHKGKVYCTNSFGQHLGCYDIASGEFKFLEIDGGSPPQVDFHDNAKNRDASLPSLVVCSGKLILVGRLHRRSGEGSLLGRLPLIKHTLVGLWELDLSAENKRWSLISVTPRDLLEGTVKSSHGMDF